MRPARARHASGTSGTARCREWAGRLDRRAAPVRPGHGGSRTTARRPGRHHQAAPCESRARARAFRHDGDLGDRTRPRESGHRIADTRRVDPSRAARVRAVAAPGSARRRLTAARCQLPPDRRPEDLMDCTRRRLAAARCRSPASVLSLGSATRLLGGPSRRPPHRAHAVRQGHRPAARLVARTLPVFSLLVACQPGAALRDLRRDPRQQDTTAS